MSHHKFVIILTSLASLVLWLTFFAPRSSQAAEPVHGSTTPVKISAAVEVALQQGDKVRVVVALRPPNLDAEVTTQAVQIAQTQERVMRDVPPGEFDVSHRYRSVAGLAGEVSPEGLEALRNNPDVQAVDLDMPVQIALAESTALVRANEVWAKFNLTGDGVNVAVLDTGVDVTHPDLADNLISQHCFNHGTCLPDQTDESSSAQDEQGHGSHVAGIISSGGNVAPLGVAPDAGIVAVRVLNRNGSGWTSDVVKGIEWVVANRVTYNIKVINLSLGGGAYRENCDQETANTQLYASAVESARRAGIVVFAASGNEGLPNQIMTPACISGVIAVGNVYDTATDRFTWPTCTGLSVVADEVTCSSNSSSDLDLLAPGAGILSVGLGGNSVTQSGTSMSTPHAAGVAALLLQAQPDLTPTEIETILKETGVPVRDSRTQRVTPRIDAFAAVSRVMSPTTTTSTIAGTVALQGRETAGGVEVYVSEQSCDTATFETPITMTDDTGFFEIGSTPTVAASTPITPTTYQCLQVVAERYLIGQHENPTGNLGTITLLNGDVNGDNRITILDIAAIAQNYGSDNAASDLNSDNLVDIFDLSLAAKNYEQQGPLTDWQ